MKNVKENMIGVDEISLMLFDQFDVTPKDEMISTLRTLLTSRN